MIFISIFMRQGSVEDALMKKSPIINSPVFRRSVISNNFLSAPSMRGLTSSASGIGSQVCFGAVFPQPPNLIDAIVDRIVRGQRLDLLVAELRRCLIDCARVAHCVVSPRHRHFPLREQRLKIANVEATAVRPNRSIHVADESAESLKCVDDRDRWRVLPMRSRVIVLCAPPLHRGVAYPAALRDLRMKVRDPQAGLFNFGAPLVERT